VSKKEPRKTHDQKLFARICTYSNCEEPGKNWHMDPDEPRGSYMLLCDFHNRQYQKEAEAEIAAAGM